MEERDDALAISDRETATRAEAKDAPAEIGPQKLFPFKLATALSLGLFGIIFGASYLIVALV